MTTTQNILSSSNRMPPPVFSSIAYPSVGIHRGAIDQTMITSKAPPDVMRRVRTALDQMSIKVEEESEWRYRCVRPRRADNDHFAKDERVREDSDGANGPDTHDASLASITPRADVPKANNILSDTASSDDPSEPAISNSPTHAIYGSHTEDPGGEVRFFVELTHLDRLEGTYSLDIRRLKGNLRSYKFIYDSLRAITDLQS